MKAAMVRSSQTLSKGTSPPLLPPPTPHSLRKAQSAQSINAMTSPKSSQKQLLDEYDLVRSPIAQGHSRGKSLDAPRTSTLLAESSKGGKEKKDKDVSLSPQKYCNLLLATSSTQLDIEVVKKLRLMLRNESARYDHRSIESQRALTICLVGRKNLFGRVATVPCSHVSTRSWRLNGVRNNTTTKSYTNFYDASKLCRRLPLVASHYAAVARHHSRSW